MIGDEPSMHEAMSRRAREDTTQASQRRSPKRLRQPAIVAGNTSVAPVLPPVTELAAWRRIPSPPRLLQLTQEAHQRHPRWPRLRERTFAVKALCTVHVTVLRKVTIRERLMCWGSSCSGRMWPKMAATATKRAFQQSGWK